MTTHISSVCRCETPAASPKDMLQRVGRSGCECYCPFTYILLLLRICRSQHNLGLCKSRFLAISLTNPEQDILIAYIADYSVAIDQKGTLFQRSSKSIQNLPITLAIDLPIKRTAVYTGCFLLQDWPHGQIKITTNMSTSIYDPHSILVYITRMIMCFGSARIWGVWHFSPRLYLTDTILHYFFSFTVIFLFLKIQNRTTWVL